MPLPAADPKLADKPVQLLLTTRQSRYSDEGADHHYVEYAIMPQNPQGLAASGTIALPWQPDRTDLIVHKVHLLRAGKVIDLLEGTKFTVLRRENRLEYAMLDGTLTAVLQSEGLQVGDILNVAYSYRAKRGAIAFAAENFFALAPEVATRRIKLREIWPAGKQMRWKAAPGIGAPKLRQTKLGDEPVLDIENALAPKPPANAPARYQLPPFVQITAYSSWNDISKLLAPRYDTARQVPPTSPLQAEIARIAAAHSDAPGRAIAALRLVQDQIRYVALAMGDGGHVPATADQTWSRKYGDCKGKTATLLALLKGLGIEGEPVLVNSGGGDTLGELLPQVNLFDHVIVRARIGGRSYWLDGTGSGDRDLDSLASSTFGFGLPVRLDGAPLEKLPLDPPPHPLTTISITYDASQGFRREVPLSGELVFRGAAAALYRIALTQMSKEDIRKALNELNMGLPSEEEVSSFDLQSDDRNGTFTYSFRGKASMDWASDTDPKAQRHQFSNYVISWDVDLERKSGADDVPVALPFPIYLTSRETVILPNKGEGFTIEGKDLNSAAAGTEISRRTTIEQGKAVAVSSFRRLKNEISAAEVTSAETAIEAINSNAAYVRAPEGYESTSAELEAILKEVPQTSVGYLDRGYLFLQKGSFSKAIADFEKAAEKYPNWSRPHANRAIALIHQKKLAEARLALDKAAAADDSDFVVDQGNGLLHAAMNKHEEAIAAFSRSLAKSPDNDFTLSRRASSYESLGRFKEALSDWKRVTALAKKNSFAHLSIARIHAHLSEAKSARESLDSALAVEPENPIIAIRRADLLRRIGQPEEARAAYASALLLIDQELKRYPGAPPLAQERDSILIANGQIDLALKEVTAALAQQSDNAHALSRRCWLRTIANKDLDKAEIDCTKALEYNIGLAEAAHNRGFVRIKLGKLDQAIADFNDLISWEPQRAGGRYGRALARLKKGDRSAAEADFSAARSLSFDVEHDYSQYGFQPQM